LLLVQLPEILCQDHDVFTALAQPRQPYADYVDAIIQVGAKSSRIDFPLWISIRRAYQARFDGSLRLIANSRKLSVLQKMQEFALQAQIEVGNLIKE
jgi:hypothetical protein